MIGKVDGNGIVARSLHIKKQSKGTQEKKKKRKKLNVEKVKEKCMMSTDCVCCHSIYQMICTSAPLWSCVIVVVNCCCWSCCPPSIWLLLFDILLNCNIVVGDVCGEPPDTDDVVLDNGEPVTDILVVDIVLVFDCW